MNLSPPAILQHLAAGTLNATLGADFLPVVSHRAASIPSPGSPTRKRERLLEDRVREATKRVHMHSDGGFTLETTHGYIRFWRASA